MENSAKSKWQVRLAAVLIFLVGFISGALTLNIYRAQQGPALRPSTQQRFQRVLDRLDLTEDQKTEVKKIFDDARAQLAEVRKESAPKFHEVRRQTDERLRAVLNDEQWEQFQQLVREGRRGRRHGGRGPRNK